MGKAKGNISIQDVIHAGRVVKFPVVLDRFNCKITKKNCNKYSSYCKISKEMVKMFQDKTLKAQDFCFQPDVFTILRRVMVGK